VNPAPKSSSSAPIPGVDSVSWSPDVGRVVSASQGGTSRIWDATISIENLVANAHRRVSRELTTDERRKVEVYRVPLPAWLIVWEAEVSGSHQALWL
jgi:WD40 repeat protein